MNKPSDNTIATSKTPDHQWQIDFFFTQFKKESDRAAVILAISIIDQTLQTLIKGTLAPIPSAKDPLFDDATSPFSSFSSKIDIAFRLGLISSNLCRDLHLLRRIRNSFAHDIFDCSFENMSVINRIIELKKSMTFLESKDFNIDIEKGYRGIFLNLTGSIIWHINNLIKRNSNIKESKLEWMYLITSSEKKIDK